MSKPRKHAELIKAWANGASIEWYDEQDGTWEHVEIPGWDDESQYRVKPERQYPPSSLSLPELMQFIKSSNDWGVIAKNIADAAVKRHIQDTEN